MKVNKTIKSVEIPVRFYCDNCRKDNLDFEDVKKYIPQDSLIFGFNYECLKCGANDDFVDAIDSIYVTETIKTVFDIGGPYKSIIGK